MPTVLSQLPAPAAGDIEKFLIPAVALLSIVALVKKVFPGKRSDSDFVTKTELTNELASVRDKIDARFLTLSEKIDRLGSSLHERLTELQSNVARLDERTKN